MNFWRWLGRAYQARREARKVDASWAELMTVAVTIVVAAEVAKNIEKTVEQAAAEWVADHRYYQRNWWLLVDERERREDGLPYPERPSRMVEWPPFTGVRVALGGDRA